jgi:hypothetical protein
MYFSQYLTLAFFLLTTTALVLVPPAATATGGAAVVGAQRQEHVDMSRHLEFVNQDSERVAVDWLHPETGETVPYSAGVVPGERITLNSFVNHTFVIRYPSNTPAGGLSLPAPTYVTVTEEVDQVIVVKQGLQVEHERAKNAQVELKVDPTEPIPSESTELVRLCREKALAGAVDAEQALNVLSQCLENNLAVIYERKNEELAIQELLRTSISASTENYTCADTDRETSTPKEVRSWTHNGVTRQANILLDRPSSQIHVVTDFISPEECKAIENAASPLLHRGTVADGKGGSKLSDNRKAWQAGIKVDWSTDNLIAAVSQRLFDYANHVTHYNLTVESQEDIMSIQYFGNGIQDRTPDRYMPHCDGDCDGLPHKRGGRVATMVMYCEIPEVGGGTNFQNSNAFVKPQVGAAAFFSYLNPETRLHEKGFTLHSGCPVLKGTKKIAVQWIRIGVDADNPWDSFDTLTVRKRRTESSSS